MKRIQDIIVTVDDISSGLDDFLSVIYKRYGYNFMEYSRSSLKRRIVRYMNRVQILTLFDLKHAVLNDENVFIELLHNITVNVTEMFRDPTFYITLQQKVFPVLATYPHIKIWHAGCSTGEEVYSLAILLKEAGLLDRCKQYATDINSQVLKHAQEGVFSLKQMREYTSNYQKAGGKKDFSQYYTAHYDHAIFNKELRSNMIFAQHNLVSDHSFNEFNLILCRNVLIYFDKPLQNRVIKLFINSMCPLGFLALGNKESLLFSEDIKKFETIEYHERVFRRTY